MLYFLILGYTLYACSYILPFSPCFVALAEPRLVLYIEELFRNRKF